LWWPRSSRASRCTSSPSSLSLFGEFTLQLSTTFFAVLAVNAAAAFALTRLDSGRTVKVFRTWWFVSRRSLILVGAIALELLVAVALFFLAVGIPFGIAELTGYWTQQGRLSIDACMTAVAFLGLALVAASPFEESGQQGRWIAVAGIATNGLLVVVTMLKDKLKMGLIGIAVPGVALVGAVRLAKPDSVWTRLLYPKSGRRMRRSLARYERREARWGGRRNRLYDLIGGMPR
jgi:hypothetical protein